MNQVYKKNKVGVLGLVFGMFGVLIPYFAFAATPTFSVLGVQSIRTNEATVLVSFDSNGAQYPWESQPKISINYINQTTGQAMTTATVNESMGSRTTTFVLRNLTPSTTYSYKVIMNYGGTTYVNNTLTFRTADAPVVNQNTNIPTGYPTFSISGIAGISHNEASISVAYDSRNAQYQWENQPKLSIVYREVNDTTVYTSGSVGESMGARSTLLVIRDLKPNTKYAYKAVLYYAGNRYETGEQTFTTKPYGNSNILIQSGTATVTTNTQSGNNDTIFNFFTGGNNNSNASVANAIGVNKLATNLESIVKTGGYGSKNGVFLSITDSHARVVDGDTFEYTIQYHNENKKTLKVARIVVQLPDQYAFDSGDGNTVYSNNDNVVTIYIGSIQPYESGMVTFKARALGGENKGVETKAMLVYTGGSVSAVDRDAYVGGSQGVLGATVFGSGFFPQTFFGWLIVIVILLIIMIVARRYMKPAPLPEIKEHTEHK